MRDHHSKFMFITYFFLPSPSRIKQLNVCWKEKIKNLNNIIQVCNQAISKREELLKRLTEVDLAKSTNKVRDPKLILNSLFLIKQQFDEQVEIFKGLSVEKLYGILEYDEDEILDNSCINKRTPPSQRYHHRNTVRLKGYYYCRLR
jgi:hypothetical protein